MINLNTNIANVAAKNYLQNAGQVENQSSAEFKKSVDAIKKQITSVDSLQKEADQSVAELLTGKNEDINTVVSSVAKADMSFKLLVGVRNKLIEAYKQTMQMSV